MLKKLFAGIFPFLLLIIAYLHPITAYTQDLGRHLFTGKLIVETLSVPKTNLFSYTFPDFPFINHHYLSEIIFFLSHSFGGDIGLQLFTVIIVSAAFGCVFFFAARQNSILVLFLTSILYLPILFERTDIRPEIFSFLLTALYVVILYVNRQRPTRLLFLLPLLQLLWVNLHIYFAIGILLITLFIIDSLITNRHQNPLRKTKFLLLVLVGCLFGSLLNPNGVAGILAPFTILRRYGYTIEENQNIFFLESMFHKPSILYFKISVFLLFLALLSVIKRTRPVDWLLAVTFSILGAVTVRNLPLFVFATFIPLTTALTHFSQKKLKQILPFHLRAIWLWSILSGMFIYIIVMRWQTHPPGFGAIPGAKPAADFFIQNNLKGPVFNNFDIGSYLIYRLYPLEKVFVDGRPEAYPVHFFQNVYIPMQYQHSRFEMVANQYQFNSIFFSHTDQTPWAEKFLSEIVNNKQWQIVYLDEMVVILLRNTPRNQSIIARYAKPLASLEPTVISPSVQSYTILARVFMLFNLPDQELSIQEKLLSLDETNCFALSRMTQLYSQSNHPALPIYQQKYLQHCQ